MTSSYFTLCLLGVCIGCSATNTRDNVTTDSELVSNSSHAQSTDASDRLGKLETFLQEHFKDFRPMQDDVTVPRDCFKVYKQGWTKSGVYTISPDGSTKMDVYCEQELDGGGWTVFQNRVDGSEDFYRNWQEYKSGFGNLNGEFWLGNDNLYLLTKQKNQKLKIQLKDWEGEFAYADYSEFWIDSENLQYKLHVGGFTAVTPPGDSMASHNGHLFSTKDRDYDIYEDNCAQLFKGGWWYTRCHDSNLNGLFGSPTHAKGLSWQTWKGHKESMTGARMMLKKLPKT